MQICIDHWAMLRKEIDDSGMGHLVAKDSTQLKSRIQKEATGHVAVPDPLFEANAMIISRAVEELGAEIIYKDANCTEQICPLCEINNRPIREEDKKHRVYPDIPMGEEWIKTLINFLKKEFTEHGWLTNQN